MLWQSNFIYSLISTDIFRYGFGKKIILILLKRIICCTKQQFKSSLQTVKETVNEKV